MIIDEIEDTLEHGYGESNDRESGEFIDEHEHTEDAGDIDRTDLLKLYLREASRSSMLTAEGEVAAGKRIERARKRLMKLLSRSLVVAQYCVHLRQMFQLDLESPADLIEEVAGRRDQSKPVSALAETALARVESAFRDLSTPRVNSPTPWATRKRRGAVGENTSATTPVRLRGRLAHSIRSITFTPAGERRLVALVEAAALGARKGNAVNDTKSANLEAVSAVLDEFDIAASVITIVTRGLASRADLANQASQTAAAIND